MRKDNQNPTNYVWDLDCQLLFRCSSQTVRPRQCQWPRMDDPPFPRTHTSQVRYHNQHYCFLGGGHDGGLCRHGSGEETESVTGGRCETGRRERIPVPSNPVLAAGDPAFSSPQLPAGSRRGWSNNCVARQPCSWRKGAECCGAFRLGGQQRTQIPGAGTTAKRL